MRYPTLAIEACAPADDQTRLTNLHAWDGIISVSANAVRHALAHIFIMVCSDLLVVVMGFGSV